MVKLTTILCLLIGYIDAISDVCIGQNICKSQTLLATNELLAVDALPQLMSWGAGKYCSETGKPYGKQTIEQCNKKCHEEPGCNFISIFIYCYTYNACDEATLLTNQYTNTFKKSLFDTSLKTLVYPAEQTNDQIGGTSPNLIVKFYSDYIKTDQACMQFCIAYTGCFSYQLDSGGDCVLNGAGPKSGSFNKQTRISGYYLENHQCIGQCTWRPQNCDITKCCTYQASWTLKAPPSPLRPELDLETTPYINNFQFVIKNNYFFDNSIQTECNDYANLWEKLYKLELIQIDTGLVVDLDSWQQSSQFAEYYSGVQPQYISQNIDNFKIRLRFGNTIGSVYYYLPYHLDSQPFRFWYPECMESTYTSLTNDLGDFQFSQSVVASISSPGKFNLKLTSNYNLECLTVTAYENNYGVIIASDQFVNPASIKSQIYKVALPASIADVPIVQNEGEYEFFLSNPSKIQQISFKIQTTNNKNNGQINQLFYQDLLTLNVVCPTVKLGTFMPVQIYFSTTIGQLSFNFEIQEAPLPECGAKFRISGQQTTYKPINIFGESKSPTTMSYQFPLIYPKILQNTRFYIQAIGIDQNFQNEIFSQEFTIIVQCGPFSNQITAPTLIQNEQNKDLKEINYPNNEYKVANFAQTNDQCPIYQLEIVPISDSEGSQNWVSTANVVYPKIISSSSDLELKVQFANYTTITQKFAFKLMARAKGGASQTSGDIRVKLRNCDNLAPYILGNQTIEVSVYPTKISLQSKFQSSEPNECPVNNYKISQIINNRSGHPVNNIGNFCKIDNLGQLSIIIHKLTDNQLIFVKASNGFTTVWSKKLTLILKKPENIKPYFITPIKNLNYTIKNDNETFSYQIPSFRDPENSQVSLRFIYGLKSWMNYDKITNTLHMKPHSIGEHVLHFRIEDEDGGFQEAHMMIRFEYPSVENKGEVKTFIIEINTNDTNVEDPNKEKPKVIKVIKADFKQLLDKFNQEKYKVINKTYEFQDSQQAKPVQLKFSEFNHEGVLKIEFNQKLKQFEEYLNKRALQKEKFDNNELAQEIFGFRLIRDGQNINDLIDQIQVQNWNELGLEVKFDFTQPLNVSNGVTKDQIYGIVKKKSFAFFISKEISATLQDDILMEIAVPSQLPKGIKQQQVVDVAQSANNAIFAVVIVQLLSQIVLKKGMKDTFTLVFVIELVVALESYAFINTAALQIAFKQIRILIGFKYLNVNWILGQIQPNLSLSTLFMNGKERFLTNVNQEDDLDVLITTLTVACLAFTGFFFLIFVLAFTEAGRKQAIKLIEIQKNNLIWNGIIMMTYFNYISLMKKSLNEYYKNNTLGILFSLALLSYPIFAAAFLVQKYSELGMNSFEAKYENFYKDIAYKRGRRTVFFYPAFLLKRWFILFTIVIMGKNIGLQLFALLNINKASIIFYGWISPHSSKYRKWLEYYNNVLIMLLSYLMLCMTSFIEDFRTIFDIGFIFIGTFAILVLGNLTYITYVIRARFLKQRRLSILKENFIEYYEEKFRKLEDWENQQSIKRQQTREQVRTALQKTKINTSEQEWERSDSNRLSTLMEKDEIYSVSSLSQPSEYQHSLNELKNRDFQEVQEQVIIPVKSKIIFVNKTKEVSDLNVEFKEDKQIIKANHTLQGARALLDSIKEIEMTIKKQKKNIQIIEVSNQPFIQQVDENLNTIDIKYEIQFKPLKEQQKSNEQFVEKAHQQTQKTRTHLDSIKFNERSNEINKLADIKMIELPTKHFINKIDSFLKLIEIENQVLIKPIQEKDKLIEKPVENIQQKQIQDEEKTLIVQMKSKKSQPNLVYLENSQNIIETQKQHETFKPEYKLESDLFIYDYRFIKLKNFRMIPDANNGVYRGLVDQNCLPHGWGVMISSDQSVYEGQWNRGQKMGDGYFRNAKKSIIYIGAFESGMPNGYGKETLPDGTIYEGSFEDAKYHGRGKLITETEEYNGQFLQGIKNGRGRIENFITGESYHGTFSFGQKLGQGTQILANFEKYEGNFNYGAKHGYGSWWKDHRVQSTKIYRGEWQHDMWHGKGTLEYDNFSYYKGEFKNSLKHGNGILNLRDEFLFYQGKFQNDKKHGKGRQAIRGNLVHDGQWENDEPVQ